jgi:copper(I)-binding protein
VAFRAPTERFGKPSQYPQGEYDAVSRNSRRAVAIIAGVLAVAPTVSACAAGQHPQSALPTQLAEGVNATANGVDVRNVFLLGPAPGQKLTAGSSAPLYAWFVNKAPSPDRLIAVEASGVARSVEIAGGAVTLPPGRLVTTVQPPGAQATATPSATPTVTKSRPAKPRQRRTPTPGASAGVTATPGTSATPTTPAAPAAPQPSKVVLKDLTTSYAGGETVRLILRFQRAGAVTLNVPVVPRNGYYATYSPAAAEPAPSATPLPAQPNATASGTPKAGAPKARKSKKVSATPSA